jgi:hypothetical protein
VQTITMYGGIRELHAARLAELSEVEAEQASDYEDPDQEESELQDAAD